MKQPTSSCLLPGTLVLPRFLVPGFIGLLASASSPSALAQSTSSGPQEVITTAADGAYSVYATDLDGDGDADVLSASFRDDKIAWYENLYEPPLANDDCSGAIPIGIGETVYSNVGAGNSGVNMSCVSNGEASDVWFSYTAIGDCSVTIDLFGSSYDTAAAVYNGDCGALTQVDCNDDGGAVKTSASFLSFTATAGTTYLIQVGGFSGASGDGVIDVTEGVGSIVCAGNANSTGVGALLRACGSTLVSDNAVNLELTDLPLNQTVLFVNSRETILVANPGGSQGDLCIGSLALGRHSNDVLDSGATGTASLTLDLANVPTNLGRTAVVAGETWYWQAWYRDVDGGGAPTSNLSSAVGVTFN